MRKITAVFSWVAFGFSPLVVRAADFSVGTALEDTKLYFTAPLRWDEEDWLYFGVKPRHCRRPKATPQTRAALGRRGR
jgi:hypothetical protein